MPPVRNVSSVAQDVPLFGLVFDAGETKKVDDETAAALVTNPSFEIVAAKATVKKEQQSDGN